MLKKIRERGVSLRAAHVIMIIIAIAVAVILIVETGRSSAAFRELSGATDKYMELTKSARALMDASDYLTQEVQSFTVTGEKSHMDSYFDEADTNKRRENSVNTLLETAGESEAFNRLSSAMKESMKLMDTEYYAMALVAAAQKTEEIPAVVENVKLSESDKALSDNEKMEKARKIVHDEKYHTSKGIIRDNMNRCIDELEKITRQVQNESTSNMREELLKMRILIIALALGTIVFLIIASVLGINPLLKGVEKIKEDSEIPVVGAYEFRYLARTYNDMYTAFKQNIANLNYHVSHDKLTGLYNRMGYDILSANLDFSTTTVIMIDVDYFKGINDKYGHGTGDQVLQKLAGILKKVFRSDDYICRIGGDEFVVFMMYTETDYKKVLIDKIKRINEELKGGNDNLPTASISAGVVFGKDEVDPTLIMKHVDVALYSMKERGRAGCYFYVDEE